MTKIKIKIEQVHDVVCSWCPIGYSYIKAALKQLDNQIEVEFKFLPYELNPAMSKEGESIEDHLKRRNNWNTEELLRYRENLVETAIQAGLTYDFGKRTHYWNTAKAHTLIHFAEKFDKQEQVNRVLIQQYFAEGLNVDDAESLANIGSSVGLNRDAVMAAFTAPEIAAEMLEKQVRVRGLNLRSVPTFIFNDIELVSGSNSVEFFVQYFSHLLAKTPA
jgi:predicted DsbA family dithiol-disulfide isomerase